MASIEDVTSRIKASGVRFGGASWKAQAHVLLDGWEVVPVGLTPVMLWEEDPQTGKRHQTDTQEIDETGVPSWQLYYVIADQRHRSTSTDAPFSKKLRCDADHIEEILDMVEEGGTLPVRDLRLCFKSHKRPTASSGWSLETTPVLDFDVDWDALGDD